MTQYHIFVTDGKITHLDVRDENSNLLPLELSELESLLPEFNAGLVVSLAAKAAEHAEDLEGKLAELAKERDLAIDGLRTELALVTMERDTALADLQAHEDLQARVIPQFTALLASDDIETARDLYYRTFQQPEEERQKEVDLAEALRERQEAADKLARAEALEAKHRKESQQLESS